MNNESEVILAEKNRFALAEPNNPSIHTQEIQGEGQ
jgi:hypothetical protein